MRQHFQRFAFGSACFFLMIGVAFAADDTDLAKNGHAPAGQEYTIAFEENLRIGPEAGDEFIWPQIGTTVQADANGNMYVMVAGENYIAMLDSDGNFIKRIGSAGQGPGEYQALSIFQVLADGRAIGFESLGLVSSVSWYDAEMNFVEKKSMQPRDRLYQSIILSGSGELGFANYITLNQAAGKMDAHWVVVDLAGDVKAELITSETPMPTPAIMQSSDEFAKFMGGQIKATAQGLLGFTVFDSENNVYTATAKKYEITRWDANMNKQLVISREYKPIAQTEDDIEAAIAPVTEILKARLPPNMTHLTSENTIRKAVELAEFPPVKHPVNGLNILEDGTLLVYHNASLVDKSLTMDMFSKDGKYIGDAVVPAANLNAFNMLFRNGQMYRIEANEDDENVLVRYNYKLVPKK